MTTQLPPQSPPEPDEKLPGETELAALYRQLPQSEPSPALDAAVLRTAAQALAPDEESPTVLRERRKAERERGDWVHPKPVTSPPVASPSADGSRRRPRWPIALSSAATLVLAAGLVWHMRELPPTTSTPTAMDSAAPAQAKAAASATPPAAAMQPAEPAPPTPPEPAKQPPSEMLAAPLRTPATNALRQAAPEQLAERASSKAKVIGGLSQYAPAAVAAPAAPPVALQETASSSAADKPAVAEAAPEMPATMAAAPAPAAPPADQTTVPQVAGDSAANTANEAAPVSHRVQTRMPVAPTPFTPVANMDTTSYPSDTPAQELDKIRQLFALGHDDEAQQRLTAYHLAHPRWDLPLDLQARLRKP
ncbi:hypothetical protein GCM10008098_10260 [Rhodanobacter panaciterrae]|uniref:Meckel syndrome type 1 protein n=1 Tax=Rhodanobacter panaciterrae TaxID=490572 RepID=A0ABQ2ZQI3_9GAMM|nr:hypothetical protein [Rhodanobacter panaciterrae]GGY19819.1 hypothetical protein GCM10008098_10260 [Rhodanobacter panaciterrae]